MDTKVVPIIVTYLFVKFQTHQTCVARDIAKILQLGFWKNWNSREVVMQFFDLLNFGISICNEYQSCITWNYLTPVKISKHFDEQNASYEFSRNLQLPAHSVNHAFRVLLICPSILWIIPMLGTILLVLTLPYCWSAMFSNLRMLVINSSTKRRMTQGMTEITWTSWRNSHCPSCSNGSFEN